MQTSCRVSGPHGIHCKIRKPPSSGLGVVELGCIRRICGGEFPSGDKDFSVGQKCCCKVLRLDIHGICRSKSRRLRKCCPSDEKQQALQQGNRFHWNTPRLGNCVYAAFRLSPICTTKTKCLSWKENSVSKSDTFRSSVPL